MTTIPAEPRKRDYALAARRLIRMIVFLAASAAFASWSWPQPFMAKPRALWELSRMPPSGMLPVPVQGVAAATIANTFGAPRGATRTHAGLDIFATRGTPVLSTTRGIVAAVREGGLGGRQVWVLGPARERHYYTHLDHWRQGLAVGDIVLPGDMLGSVGDTGNARGTPPHLHYGIYGAGGAYDPLPLLRAGMPEPRENPDASSFRYSIKVVRIFASRLHSRKPRRVVVAGNRMRIALLLLSTTLFASCSCQRDADDAQPTATPTATQPSEATTPAVDEAEIQKLARLQDQRYAAFSGAASVVQNYLAAVGARDWKKADVFWVNESPGSGEADLRSVKKLQSLRIENETPEALDKEAVPKALEVPVNIRARFAGGEPMKRYRGWYRVRQKVSGEGWEITSASIDAVPR